MPIHAKPVSSKMPAASLKMRKGKISQTSRLLLCSIFALALLAAACSSDDSSTATPGQTSDNPTSASASRSLLDVVRERDKLICGSRSDLTGFASTNADGEYEGFDIEFCRVVAAGILGDATKLEIRPLGPERFTAVQAGEVDILFRNATATASRDGREGLSFPFTTVYDGQRMIVRADSGITTLEELDGATICVIAGTTTELNLNAVFSARGLRFSQQVFTSHAELRTAYRSGTCEGYTADGSALAIYKFTAERDGGPEQRILDEVMSKEPLGAVIADGDSKWEQAVKWVLRATIQAWEFGLDSTNIDSYSGEDVNILNFLGRTGFDPGLDLDLDFAVNVVKQVGNYKEIYDRTLGAVGLEMEGSLNRLWSEGGLFYNPPYR